MVYKKESRIAGFSNAEKDKLRKESDTEENAKGIDNHIKAAEHFALASKYHYEAARSHGEGNHEKANHYALLAHGHSSIAMDYQEKDAWHHALQE